MGPPQSFTSSSNWERYAKEKGIPLPSSKPPILIDKIPLIPLDFISSRARQQREHTQWRVDHPLSSVGYACTFISILASDGHVLEVKISHPNAERMAKHSGSKKLPVLFIAFGGGWIQGTHTTEEMWLLWPVYPALDVVTISVTYRLGPENPAPVWVQDCWDVLSVLLSGTSSVFDKLDVEVDLEKVVLAGSSAGGGIAATLSQRCRDTGVPIHGVILNVPVLCDYRHFPLASKLSSPPSTLRSYEHATEALLPSGAMKWIWETLYPDSDSSLGGDASPLLGDLRGLPKHVVFVAGQDALCDEGLAYVRRLREAGIEVDARVYDGVPHTFGEMWDLEATRRWHLDIRRYLKELFKE